MLRKCSGDMGGGKFGMEESMLQRGVEFSLVQ